jgi:hypothetical protein
MPEVFGWQHIVYLAIFLAVSVASIVIIKKTVKDDNKLNLVIKCVALVLLGLILWNRSLIAMRDGAIRFIPNTFCGLTSLLFAICALTLKRDNLVFHFLIYMSIWGCTLTMVYPDFIGQAESIFYPLTISGLLHHSVSLYLSVLMIATGYFKPTIYKFHIFPIGLAFYMSYGVFLQDCLGIPAMYISEPLIEGTIFTWYFVGLLICIITATILAIYEIILKKHNYSTTTA